MHATQLLFSRHLLRSTAVAACGAAILAQAGLAWGEPKNELPFTRPVVTRATQATPSVVRTSPEIRGEPKNELPFTRPVVTQQPATVVIESSNGFKWTDGAIGLAAGIGVALSGAAIVGLTRRSPHTAS
jgi:hypothetical protein